MNTMNPQQVFFTPLPFQEALIKLQARLNSHPAASIFSKREIKFPEVLVTVTPEGRFSLRQRKTYFNPWAPIFEATLSESDQQGTLVEGALKTYPTLRRWIHLYHAALMGGVVASVMSLHTLYSYSLPKLWIIGQIVSVVWLVGLMACLVMIKIRCERHYKELAQGEDVFILSFLESALETRRISQTAERGTPAEELPAA